MRNCSIITFAFVCDKNIVYEKNTRYSLRQPYGVTSWTRGLCPALKLSVSSLRLEERFAPPCCWCDLPKNSQFSKITAKLQTVIFRSTQQNEPFYPNLERTIWYTPTFYDWLTSVWSRPLIWYVLCRCQWSSSKALCAGSHFCVCPLFI